MSGYQFFAEEALTVSTTAVGFTAATYGGADFAHVYVDTADIRVFFGGGTPTASAGIPASAGDEIILESKDEVSRFRAIREGGTDAVLRANFGVRS
jgi:hypothetical protein